MRAAGARASGSRKEPTCSLYKPLLFFTVRAKSCHCPTPPGGSAVINCMTHSRFVSTDVERSRSLKRSGRDHQVGERHYGANVAFVVKTVCYGARCICQEERQGTVPSESLTNDPSGIVIPVVAFSSVGNSAGISNDVGRVDTPDGLSSTITFR